MATTPHSGTRLALAHMWVAFILFAVALLLGVYQVLERDGVLGEHAASYYASTTLHGVVMGYALTIFFITGAGYALSSRALKTAVWGAGLAWTCFWVMLVGTVLAAVSVLAGKASVLYTFYPPQLAHWTFYVGAALLVAGSIGWILITLVMSARWKQVNPGRPLPLAQFGMSVCALVWAWTMVGVVIEVLLQLIPLALGLIPSIDVNLARSLFAWTLHPIVYFWLIPCYVFLYTVVPEEAGGYLFSDEMARIAFVMLLIFGLPIGMHHLYMDPPHSAGFKLLQGFGTFMVAIPTLLTGFTVWASLETSGRLRGGSGLFGWMARLKWGEPTVLAGILALFMLIVGGFGGLVNASYGQNTVVHNTQWITAHFHYIFGGVAVTGYFGLAYWLWPRLTGHALWSPRLALAQLWLWVIGMNILSLPWHWVGLLGMPRRIAYYAYAPEFWQPWLPWTGIMIIGGVLLLISGVLLVINLALTHGTPRWGGSGDFQFARPLEPVFSVPASLNGFALWNWLLLVLMAVSWGYPIAQFFLIRQFNALPWGFS
ncbi:MAG: cbb3-type cytochrome c oxidase subunit I [Burkholderiaceae bacterium]